MLHRHSLEAMIINEIVYQHATPIALFLRLSLDASRERTLTRCLDISLYNAD